jgi:hypothetical protein
MIQALWQPSSGTEAADHTAFKVDHEERASGMELAPEKLPGRRVGT